MNMWCIALLLVELLILTFQAMAADAGLPMMFHPHKLARSHHT